MDLPPGEGSKRAFSEIKKLRQDRFEAFSSGNYAFFSVLALFLRVLVAKLCVFMAFLGKKIRPQRSLKSGLLCGSLRERERLKKRGFRGRKGGAWRKEERRWGGGRRRSNVGTLVCVLRAGSERE